MNAQRPAIRFTLQSLVLFIICCGLFVGAGIRLWRYYWPSAASTTSAVPALIDRFQSGRLNSDYQWQYIVAFGKIGPGAREAVPLLIQLLTESLTASELRELRSGLSPDQVRAQWESRAKYSAKSLGQIGAAAREATPHLIELSHSQYVERTIQVPTPDQLQLRSGELSDFAQFRQKTVSETALEALQQIQSSPAEHTH